MLWLHQTRARQGNHKSGLKRSKINGTSHCVKSDYNVFNKNYIQRYSWLNGSTFSTNGVYEVRLTMLIYARSFCVDYIPEDKGRT